MYRVATYREVLLTIALVLALSLFPNRILAQPYTISVEHEPYVDLTDQDIIVHDTSKLWKNHVNYFKTHMAFPAYGELYELFSDNTLRVDIDGMLGLEGESPFYFYAFDGLSTRTARGQVSELSLKLTIDTNLAKTLRFQWKNMIPPLGDKNDYLNVQLWLYEDGRIEVRIGGWYMEQWGFGSATGPMIAMGKGYPEYWFLGGPASTPSLISKSQECVIGMPDSGTVYKFTPVTSSVKQSNRDHHAIYASNGRLHLPAMSEPAMLTLTNILGQTMLTTEIDEQGSIDIQYLPAGAYHVALHAVGKIIASQMVMKH